MPTLIDCATPVPVPGGKQIHEYVGVVNSGTEAVSIALMRSPAGWSEPGQRPAFDEFTVVMKGALRVEYEGGSMDVRAGQAVVSPKGEWVRYSTPHGAEYMAICLPAFTPQAANRDGE
jgi:ethanolamine utilization protein EutQ (cupin superfamily)